MSFILVQLWPPPFNPNARFMGDLTPIPVAFCDTLNSSSGMRPGAPNPTTNPSLDPESRAAQHEKSPQNPPPNTNFPQYSAFPSQQHAPQHRPDAFNMNNIGGALPDVQYQNYNMIQQRQMPGHSPSYPIQSMAQFPTSQASNPSMIAYTIPYQGQFNTMYPANHAPSSHQMQGPTNNSQFFQSQGYTGQSQQPGAPYYIQSNQYGPQGHMYPAPSPQYALKNPYSSEVRQQSQQGSDHLRTSVSGAGRSNSIGSLCFRNLNNRDSQSH